MQATKEYRAQHMKMIEEWRQSGLSQKRFCVANNIAYHVFHYWYGVYRSEQKTTDSFLPLNLVPAAGQAQSDINQIILAGHNGIQLKIPFTDQSVGFIKQLLLS